MRKMLMAFCGAVALVAPSQAQQSQPSPYQSRELRLAAFDRVKVAGPFKVAIVVADEPASVRLFGPPALLADTIATVDGDTLTIRFREGAHWSWNPGSGMNVVVKAPGLVSADLEGAPNVEIYGVRGETFAVASRGSGTIALRGVDAGRVRFATAGSGEITAEGNAQEASYAVGGSGSIDAKRLRVGKASIALGGAGSVYADVSSEARVAVSGSGRVEVVGGAACSEQPAHSSQVECR